ncbi:MAG: tryptophan-rich sensory protein [Clostridia bacterium]|nr:tryptophan-rich sensory protein [Clostridia bacterium]
MTKNNPPACLIYSNMTKVKWLWSIAIAMGIVLLYASLSAYFIKIDGWYNGLILPSIALSPKGMAIGWSLAYIVNIAIIARLIFHRKHTMIILPLVILGVLNILWCMVFFTIHSTIASFVILIIACALIFAIFVMTIRRDTIAMILLEPLFAWYVYLAIVNYYIFINN